MNAIGAVLKLRTLERIREDILVVIDRDPSVRRCAEALLSPPLAALWLHRVALRLHCWKWRILARFLSIVGRLVSGGVEIHPGARIDRRLFIDHGASIVVGETALIGDDVRMYHQVTLGSVGWWTKRGRGHLRHPVVGDRVVLGVNAAVLGPVHVGDDAIIGVRALVIESVPAGVTVRAARPSLARATNGIAASA